MKTIIKIYITLIFIGQILLAQDISYNQEFHINSVTAGAQNKPKIATLNNGNFVVCWVTYIENKRTAYGQLYSSDAVKIAGEFKINTNHYLNDSELAVTSLSDGGFIVLWRVDSIMGQIFNADASKRGNEFEVSGSYYGYYPAIAQIKNGDFVVIWHMSGPDGSDAGVFGQRYDSEGDLIGGNFQVNTYTDNAQAYANVAALTSGQFVVCWQSWGQDSSDYGIIAQIFNENGSKYDKEIIVNTSTEHEQSRPDIAGLQNGNFVICWQSKSEDGNNIDIFGQLFKDNGTKLGTIQGPDQFPVNSHKPYKQYFPQMSALPNGGFIVCWISSSIWPGEDIHDQDGSGSGIFAQQFNHDGSKWGEEFQVNDYTFLDQSFPAVSNISDERFTIVWQSNHQDDIYGKYYYNRFSQPLYPFSLVNPSLDEILSYTSIALTWREATRLRKNFPWDIDCSLYLDTDDSFSSPQVINNIYDTTYTAINLSPGETYFWKVLVRNGIDSLWSEETYGFFVDWDAVTSMEEISEGQPQAFKLKQNYPNPFNPKTIINYEFPITNFVKLTVHDLTGRKVATLVNKQQPAGRYSVNFNAQNLASGVYFYHIQMGSYQETRKMLLLR